MPTSYPALMHAALAAQLPDQPRWVEVRSLLLGGEGLISGLAGASPALAFVLHAATTVFAVGKPPAAAVLAAAHQPNVVELIAPLESAGALQALLPAWRSSRIMLHELPALGQLPRHTTGSVGLVEPVLLDRFALPPALRAEIEDAHQDSPLAVAYEAGQPVAFSYAGAITETLWDISIDTLPAYRRQGHAGRCIAHLIHYMRTRGKRPVWAALEQNPASWHLAHKLGFVPTDALVLLKPVALDIAQRVQACRLGTCTVL